MITEQQIEEIKSIIVDTVQPKAVYLIGSYAVNAATEKSDVDFLIIVKNENLPEYERTVNIQKRLLHFPQIPIDLILFTEDEVKEKKNNPLTFIGNAMQNSRMLYGS